MYPLCEVMGLAAFLGILLLVSILDCISNFFRICSSNHYVCVFAWWGCLWETEYVKGMKRTVTCVYREYPGRLERFIEKESNFFDISSLTPT
jgi:hypothetical protein